VENLWITVLISLVSVGKKTLLSRERWGLKRKGVAGISYPQKKWCYPPSPHRRKVVLNKVEQDFCSFLRLTPQKNALVTTTTFRDRGKTHTRTVKVGV
jgi:hypothetical protein